MSPSERAPEDVLAELSDVRRDEARTLMDLMARVTGEEPVVWATRIIGYGHFRHRYETGHEYEAPLAGFSPTARHHTVYLVADFAERHRRETARLGRFTHGRTCLYIKRLDDVDLDVLQVLVDRSVRVARGLSRRTAPRG
jgi:hypothetical protein